MAQIIILSFAGIREVIFHIIAIHNSKLGKVLILVDFATIRSVISVGEVLSVVVKLGIRLQLISELILSEIPGVR